MKIYSRICIEDWHIEANNGDRQDCFRGEEYTTTATRTDGSVVVFSRFWVAAPASIFGGCQPPEEEKP